MRSRWDVRFGRSRGSNDGFDVHHVCKDSRDGYVSLGGEGFGFDDSGLGDLDLTGSGARGGGSRRRRRC